MLLKSFLSAILVVGLLCSAPPPVAAQHTGPAYKDMATDILRYVNEHRTHMGLNPLKMDDIISDGAAAHSRNMASGKVLFGHSGFDDRMAKIMKSLKPLAINGWAENVAFSARPAKEVVDLWLNSPGHRKNIEGNYNMTGIGIAKGTDGELYFTQIFMRKKN